MNSKEKTSDLMTSMSERHKNILEILQLQGSISVTDLSERLNVSEVTIRKDLTALESQNKLYRTHGKAIPISPYIGDRHINEKEKQNVQEKRLIGRKAASMLEDNDSILIASGTTILYAAREMVSIRNLTVITASVSVSSILSQNKYIDVVQLGGMVRESSVSVVGSFAENMLSFFNCSKLFMGADGVDLEFGITTTNMMEANLNRMMMSSAQKTILLADSSKFGKKGFSRICGLDGIDQIITDDRKPYLVDYHVRFNDPAAQAMIPLIQTDIIEILNAMQEDKISSVDLSVSELCSVAVVLASEGYPMKPEIGREVKGLTNMLLEPIAGYPLVFCGALQDEGGRAITTGGRNITVVGFGENLERANHQAYKVIKHKDFGRLWYRDDIGNAYFIS